MKMFKKTALAARLALLTVLLNALLTAQATAQTSNGSGQVRALLSQQSANPASPQNQASQLRADPELESAQLGVLEAELHFGIKGINAIATVQGQSDGSGNSRSDIWLNELVAAWGQGAWQLSAGKKIVEWDVGYGFRPNDVVQQEKRRSLITVSAIGRPLLMAEYFDATLAASLVWVNPAASSNRNAIGLLEKGEEQAVAGRAYYRVGTVDLHGFARYGIDSGASAGAAVAWVASDALELHASSRYLRHSESLSMAAQTPLLLRGSPWHTELQNNLTQTLVGLSWSNEDQHNLILEAWWDGSAPSPQQWRDWSARNHNLLAAVPKLVGLAPALAGSLMAQNQLLSSSANLHRQNLFARWSWQNGAWQPAVDVLWTPADNGMVSTASLAWQGDQLRVNAGLRLYGGASDSILASLPVRKLAYLSMTWAF
ncbi:hypothetical protein [Undibacterium sp.]|uniref:hypothetical protein n=1 Tax=Undibacterium sp. TaxID=1914977 RepID=UPI0025F46437|nr:hypothetical protein [Undibacterium sp.]